MAAAQQQQDAQLQILALSYQFYLSAVHTNKIKSAFNAPVQ